MGYEVRMHAFKGPDLTGGTLVASLPNLGFGSMLLTDFLLERAGMDHVASADSEGFPAVAFVHAGKPRFAVRIHADPQTKLAVLRSEIAPHGAVLRPLARETITWAKKNGLSRVVCLDGINTGAPGGPDMFYVCDRRDDEEVLRKRGVAALDAGVLGGFSACLLLESRVQEFEVVGLLAATKDAESDAHSCLRFADVLPGFVPGLLIDRADLEKQLGGLEGAIRALQKQADTALRAVRGPTPQPQEFV